MRNGPVIFLAIAACTPPSTDPPESVRDRLASGSTQLVISAGPHAGSIAAAHRAADGWRAGTATLEVQSGELIAGVDAQGALRIERLAVELGSLALPESLLGDPAQLTSIHLEAERPFVARAAWSGDAATACASATAPLALSWSLVIRGETAPLGAPRLAQVPIELALAGGEGELGPAVRAEVRARSRGVLWSWADLVRLEDLELSLTATTASL